MAQQLQQPPQQAQSGRQLGSQQLRPTGQQPGQQQVGAQQGGQQQGGQQQAGQQIPTMPGVQPTQLLPSELRTLLADLGKSVDLLEWTKTVALQSGPQAAPVVQVADDAAAVGKLAQELVARDSALVPQAAELFVQAAQQALQTFQGQQGQVPGIQRTTWKLSETVEAARKVQQQYGGGQPLQGAPQYQQSIGYQQQGQQQGQQPQFQQFQ